MAITTAINDLFASIYELISSIVGTIVSVFSGIISAILNFFTGLINLAGSTLHAAIDVVGGLGRFIFGNIVVIGIIAAAGYVYVQKQQGRPVGAPIATPAKKRA